MKNITVTIDDETYREARVLAAEQGDTVTGLVRAFLVQLTGRGGAPRERRPSGVLQVTFIADDFDKPDTETAAAFGET